jgi:hypothetical protein
VTARRELPFDLDRYAQFLQKFPLQALLGRFTRFDFTAGEFPFQWQTHGLMALGCQDQIIVFNNGTGDMEVTHINHCEPPKWQLVL